MSNRNPIIILALTLAACTGPNPWMPDDTMGSTTDTSDTSVADDVTPHDLPDPGESTDTTGETSDTSDTTSESTESTSETTSGETESSSTDTGPEPWWWELGCCTCIEGQAPVCILPDDPTTVLECEALAAASGTLGTEKPWTWVPCDVWADGSFDCPFSC